LGVRTICRSTIKSILLRNGFELGPKHGEGAWDEFLKIHAKTLWACDYLSTKAFTLQGLVDVYLLVFIHLESRRIWFTPATAYPDSAWVTQQGRNFGIDLDEEPLPGTERIRHRGTKFVAAFDEILKTADCRVKTLAFRSPNWNARCERVIGTSRRKCQDHFVVLGTKHLNHLTSEFLKHYRHEQPHQGLRNERIVKAAAPEKPTRPHDVVCSERLGDLLKHYHRKAA
jgi:putative transposase